MRIRLLHGYVKGLWPDTASKWVKTVLGFIGGPAAAIALAERAGMTHIEAGLLAAVVLLGVLNVRQYFVWKTATDPLRDLPERHRQRIEQLQDVASLVCHRLTGGGHEAGEVEIRALLRKMSDLYGELVNYDSLHTSADVFYTWAETSLEKDGGVDYQMVRGLHDLLIEECHQLLGRQ